MKEKHKKAIATAGVVVMLMSAGAVIGANAFPREVQVVKTVERLVPGPEVEKIVEVPVEVEVEKTVEVEVEKIVEVQSPDMPLLLQTLYDFDGSVEFLTEDLDEDEVGQIVDRLAFVQESKTLAFVQIKRDIEDELDGMVVGDTTLFEEDIKNVVVVDDEWDVVTSDFEDGEIELSVPVRFKQGLERFEAMVQVRVKDNDAKDIDVLSVALRE